jgi:hypothetical protein
MTSLIKGRDYWVITDFVNEKLRKVSHWKINNIDLEHEYIFHIRYCGDLIERITGYDIMISCDFLDTDGIIPTLWVKVDYGYIFETRDIAIKNYEKLIKEMNIKRIIE